MSLLGSRLILIFDLSFSMVELIGSMEATYSINTFSSGARPKDVIHNWRMRARLTFIEWQLNRYSPLSNMAWSQCIDERLLGLKTKRLIAKRIDASATDAEKSSAPLGASVSLIYWWVCNSNEVPLFHEGALKKKEIEIGVENGDLDRDF